MRWARWIVLAPIEGYRRGLSPFLAPRCRYEPSCSAYAAQAVRRFGIPKGLTLACWRLLRCNPWSRGGLDPVEGQRLFYAQPPPHLRS